MISIPLYISAEHPCSYFDSRQAETAFVDPDLQLSTELYSHLIAQGFRRSGDEVYRPYCSSCSECVSTRIAVAEFKASRQQRRCIQKNKYTQVSLKPAEFNDEHYALFIRYQQQKHTGGSMADSSPDDYINFLSSSWCDSIFAEFRIDNRLAAVAVIDTLSNGLSAVYTFFEPDFADYSLGVYAVLWQIEHAQNTLLDYVYLGYWIESCPKMSYKTRYRPIEGFINQQWQQLP